MEKQEDQGHRRLFRALPEKLLLLRAGSHEVLAATSAYLQATQANEQDVIGKTVFQVAPYSLVSAESSPEEALQHVVSLQNGNNIPVRDENGELECIIHRVDNVDPPGQGALEAREPAIVRDKPGEHGSRPDTAERLLRLAGEKVRLGAWRIELDPERVIWTRETAAIHGVPLDQAPTDIGVAMDYYAPEHREVIREVFDRCAVEGTPFDAVWRLQSADRREPWVRVIGVADRDETGRIVAVEGAFQDITSLHEAERRADAADLRQRDILESISDAFVGIDEAWCFTYVNQRACRLLDRTKESLIGKHVWDEFPQVRDTEFHRNYAAAMSTRRTHSFRALFDPTDRWFDVSAYPIPEGLAIYFRDVTRSHEQEEQLRLAHERAQLIAKATNDVIWDWNMLDNTIDWDDSMQEIFGYSSAELEPGVEFWRERVHPEDVDRVLRSIREAIESDSELWQCEYRFLRRDGSCADVIDRGFVIRDRRGEATRMVGSILDITERKQLESRLRESQKMEAVGHLTGGVAHDFNNLLTVILGNAEMLEEAVSDPEQRPLAEMIAAAAERGAELTSRLLAFSRRQPLNPKPTDINALIEATRGLIRRTLPEDIELTFVPHPDIGVAEIDAGELGTALVNLAVNARDAMPDGGRLTIETSTKAFSARDAAHHPDTRPGDHVSICVSDTGTGMDADTLQRAFEPFFTTKRAGEGSGLGLSMVFGFTKQSGGHITIDSEPGAGTSVTLYFPTISALATTGSQRSHEASLQTGTEHILVAEDDELVRQHLEKQLQALGYRVSAAGCGTEALDILERGADVDLLLTDVVMPGGMNGRELAERARAAFPVLQVLFTSGYTANAISHLGRLAPGIHFLSKPYSREELAGKVRLALEDAAETSENSWQNMNASLYPRHPTAIL